MKKKIIILVSIIAFLVLIGGGIASYYLWYVPMKNEAEKKFDHIIENYIDEFNMYNDLSEDQMAELIPYLLIGDMAGFDSKIDQIKKDSTNDKLIHIPLPSDLTKLDDIDESELEKVISCSYECDGLIMLSKFDDDFYTIEDDDYEICLTLDQMQFLMESFNRIKDKKIK